MSDNTPSDDDDVETGKLGNGNAEKHSLYSDRENLYNRLDEHEKRLVVEISTDLLAKFDADVGAYEREAIRNIAVDAIKRRRYNDYIFEAEELVGDESSEKASQAYSRLVRDTTKELKELGLLDENPESRKADAAESWMEQISEAKDDVDE